MIDFSKIPLHMFAKITIQSGSKSCKYDFLINEKQTVSQPTQFK